MGQLSWVSDSVAEGIDGPAGGLNYSHSVGCSETVIPPNTISYCIQGPTAMGYGHPIYLRSTSNTFELGLLDIIQENIPENEFSEYFEAITNEDLRRVMDAGLSLETVLETSFLESMIPSDLPPSKITLELVLPSWIETIDGEDRIILEHYPTGENRNNISIAGPTPYTYNHPILDENDEAICLQTQKTCVSTSLAIDFDTFDINSAADETIPNGCYQNISKDTEIISTRSAGERPICALEPSKKLTASPKTASTSSL